MDRGMGAAATRAATGRDYDEWRDLLEAAGALEWRHPTTVKWLVAQHGVDHWWAQGITVDFEQDRKGRLPGQQADGTFAVSMTRTVPGERLEALATVRAAVEAVHGEAHRANLGASQPVVRWRLRDGTRLVAAAQPQKPSGTPINLMAEKLPDAAAMQTAKAAIAALFAAAVG
ncbi:DUF4287 domain-containing protein [Agrococcus sp. ProA11]|uniref:DUF4287 domain-containing protein n=1 Tax=Agrococcus chionoecetis TaxID=3153752 RepID=UPI0032618503